jgi:hypothetical protein
VLDPVDRPAPALAPSEAVMEVARGLQLVQAPAEDEPDVRPLWLAVLLGLAAGIGLTAAASGVVSYLDRGRAPTE